MKRCKNGNIIFKNVAELNKEIQRKIQPQINKAIEKYHEPIDKIKEDATVEGTKIAQNFLFCLVCNALYEVPGVGDKRMKAFIKRLKVHQECVEEGVVTLTQYKNWCLEQGYKVVEIVEAECETTK